MDIVGKLPKALGGKVFMLAMTDYFSKWIEVEAFVQANGQAESSNKIIINNLKKKLGSKKGKWAKELPFLLWADRTTTKNATSQTLFSLVFGSEAVLPTEMIIPTARTSLQTIEANN
ncbi:hypothetical protein E3N88_04354 [Mikania micrantha]|uniref:Integrase catalytic domain-containing protein n=1 Tax=Mikania micrantha TaxID=192012 RepID=A0A5N6PW19_9ASTR|nr:hypothetical protein E3N88_04354 [Mikania micrantha]